MFIYIIKNSFFNKIINKNIIDTQNIIVETIRFECYYINLSEP
jgi:hypothetical protein